MLRWGPDSKYFLHAQRRFNCLEAETGVRDSLGCEIHFGCSGRTLWPSGSALGELIAEVGGSVGDLSKTFAAESFSNNSAGTIALVAKEPVGFAAARVHGVNSLLAEVITPAAAEFRVHQVHESGADNGSDGEHFQSIACISHENTSFVMICDSMRGEAARLAEVLNYFLLS
jgi:hypothetical protein